MKKIIALLLALTMVLALTACGKKPAENPESATESESDQSQAESASESDSNQSQTGQDGKDIPENSVTDETALGESVTYYTDGEYLYLKIKTSYEFDAHNAYIDIVNPGFYRTRESASITQCIFSSGRDFDEDFDQEWFDGVYVFKLDNTLITALAADDSQWAPGTWTMLLYEGESRLVIGQWLIVLEGGGYYHFEFRDSWLRGAGEGRKVEEYDSLAKQIESWFTFKADESYDEWAVFNFDGYYLEETDSQGYDKYYLMVCPEGDYKTYEDADAVDLTYAVIGGPEYSKCPYRFAFEQDMLENGKYTIVLAKMGGKVEVQFSARKKSPTDWVMDFSEAKCPKLEGTEESEESIEGDPAEYSREYWEAKYPGENICPFYIEENGVERSYYWISGFEGWNGRIESWLTQPFNWNGWHKAADGCIVNEDETLKITDDWAGGDESMSSYCTVTTEPYVPGSSETSDEESTSEGTDDPAAADSEVVKACGLTMGDVITAVGKSVGEITESADVAVIPVFCEDTSFDSFEAWLNALAENCRSASTDGKLYENEWDWTEIDGFELEPDRINVVLFIYKTEGHSVYVTASNGGSVEGAFYCSIQIY